MRFLVPWGNFVRKSGDTMSGPLTVLGKLEVQNKIEIIRDNISINDWDFRIRPSTVAGIVMVGDYANRFGARQAAMGSDVIGNLSHFTQAASANYFPMDLGLNPGNWNIDATGPTLKGREMFFLHSLLMG